MFVRNEAAKVAIHCHTVDVSVTGLLTHNFHKASDGAAMLKRIWTDLADQAVSAVKARNWVSQRTTPVDIQVVDSVTRAVTLHITTPDLSVPVMHLARAEASGTCAYTIGSLNSRRFYGAISPCYAGAMLIATPFSQGLSVALDIAMSQAQYTKATATRAAQQLSDDLEEQLDTLSQHYGSYLFLPTDAIALFQRDSDVKVATPVVATSLGGTVVTGSELANRIGSISFDLNTRWRMDARQEGMQIVSVFDSDLADLDLFSSETIWTTQSVKQAQALSLTTAETAWLLATPEEYFSQIQMVIGCLAASRSLTSSQYWNFAALLDRAVKRLADVDVDEEVLLARGKSLDIYTWLESFMNLTVHEMRLVLALIKAERSFSIVDESVGQPLFYQAFARQANLPGYNVADFIAHYPTSQPIHALDTVRADGADLVVTIGDGQSGKIAVRFAGLGQTASAAAEAITQSADPLAYFSTLVTAGAELIQRIQFMLELASGTSEVAYDKGEQTGQGVITVLPKYPAALMATYPALTSPDVAILTTLF